MSRKDFELIASTIRGLPSGMNGELSRGDVADAFAQALKSTNANFDKQRFLAACTPKAS